jgi:hypothetical protein
VAGISNSFGDSSGPYELLKSGVIEDVGRRDDELQRELHTVGTRASFDMELAAPTAEEATPAP